MCRDRWFRGSLGRPGWGGITKQGETLAELQTMINDAVLAYFGPGTAPARVRLHFTQDPVLAVA